MRFIVCTVPKPFIKNPTLLRKLVLFSSTKRCSTGPLCNIRLMADKSAAAGYSTVALTLPMRVHPHAVLLPCTATGIPPAVRVS